jgi:hypothetical protein
MPIAELRLIEKCAEFLAKSEINEVPHRTRGIYVLFEEIKDTSKKPSKRRNKYDVVYVGMVGGAKAGIRSRLRSHSRSLTKTGRWTHFSVFRVWPNITVAEVAELEGLFRHIYRKDRKANPLNQQRTFKKLQRVRKNDFKKWINH